MSASKQLRRPRRAKPPEGPRFLRLAQFVLGPGKEREARGLGRDLLPAIASQPGCLGAHLAAEPEGGRFALVVLWRSREEADAAAEAIGPHLQEFLRDHAVLPPDIRLLEVLDSASPMAGARP